ncbi:MAG: EamA/RhaT family transporter [Actinobacteria bacterium]|nr:EamA/RhaT family transporter [Actinomycetota bacterium]
MIAIALGFAAALCWGLADFLGGIRTRALTLALVLLASQATSMAAAALIVAVGQLDPPSWGEIGPALAAGVCYLFGIAALYRALAVGTMSVISPISASGAAALPVVVGIAAGERPGEIQYLGMAVVLVGVVLATRAPEAEGAKSPREAMWLAAIAAAGIGGFYVGIDASVEDVSPFWALLATRASAFALLCAALVVVRPRLGSAEGVLPALALIGLLDVGANICFALGTETGLLSIVSVLGSLFPVATVVLARAVLDERLVRIQAVGVAASLAGVGLIAAG